MSRQEPNQSVATSPREAWPPFGWAKQKSSPRTQKVHTGSKVGLFLVAILALTANSLFGQMIAVGTPYQGFSQSWYQRQGVQFGFGFPGGQGFGSRAVGLLPNGSFTPGGQIQFTQGGFGGTVPIFGGYDPFASARFGFGRQGPNGGFRFGLELGQGSTRTITSLTPSLVVQNGSGGALFSGQVSPFVTGWIPIVGSASPGGIDKAVTRAIQSGQLRLDQRAGSSDPKDSNAGVTSPPLSSHSSGGQAAPLSTAEMATESVAAIRSRKAAERAALAAEIKKHLEDYQHHLEAGRNDLARLALNRAIVLETDPQIKQRLRVKLKSTPQKK